MHQFFIETADVSDSFVTIAGSDVNHIKNVLRMKPGEKIRVSTRDGADYFCAVSELGETFVRAQILERDETGTELPCKIYLFQGLPKSDKLELIIQKAVELGVYRIVPVAMKNCVVRLDAKKAADRVRRWQAIAESAAKQSKRSIIPEISMPMSFSEAVKEAETLDVRLVFYENEKGMKATRTEIERIGAGASVGIFIGPEGGFDVAEIDTLRKNMKTVSLGKRILRTETAGIAALAILGYHLESRFDVVHADERNGSE